MHHIQSNFNFAIYSLRYLFSAPPPLSFLSSIWVCFKDEDKQNISALRLEVNKIVLTLNLRLQKDA